MNIKVSATTLLFLLTWCEEICAAPSRCDRVRYQNNGKCKLCDKCGVGEEVTHNCGHHTNGTVVGPKCATCLSGTYQDEPAALECSPCSVKIPERSHIIKSCTATSDTVFACLPGWYDDEGTCKECTYCCADDPTSSPLYEKKCGNDGIGKCSCKQHPSCQERKCAAVNATTSPKTPISSHDFTTQTPRTNATAKYSATVALFEYTKDPTTEAGSALPPGAIFPLWWIFAPVTFFIVLLVLFIYLWRRKKCVSGRSYCEDKSPSSSETVHTQGSYQQVADLDVSNKAKLVTPPSESFSETKDLVCSCSSVDVQPAHRSKSLATASPKHAGRVCKEDYITDMECSCEAAEPFLKQETEATVQVAAPAKTSTGVIPRDIAEREATVGGATCVEQDNPEKLQGGLPIPVTVYSWNTGDQCACQQIARISQQEQLEKYNGGKMTNQRPLKVTHARCPYRPKTITQREHTCPACQPQPSDPLWDIIRRNCLQEELCEKLNQNNDWKKIVTFIRKDESIETLESKENSARGTLDKLRTSIPNLKLEEFFDILKKIDRPDLQQLITEHHMKCDLCKKNSFDSASCSSL